MADINLGARPDLGRYLKVTSVDFKVTDPSAADPNAPVDMIGVNTPFIMHFAFQITGTLKNYFNSHDWSVNFYADAMGVDVPYGEVHWHFDALALTPVGNDTYELKHTVQSGLSHIAVFEFGAIAWLPTTGLNAYVEGVHVEVAPTPI